MGVVRIAGIICALAVVYYYARIYFNGPMCGSDVRMDGKVVIVTGANTGLGLETVVDLVSRGARVYMACRSIERGEKAAGEVQTRTGAPEENSPVLKLDLSSLKSVRQFVQEFKKRESRLDVLINNAGVAWIPERRLTQDGFELTLGINHLGHFLLTNLLLDTLKASAPSRVVTVASYGYTLCSEPRWDDLMLDKDYSRFFSYGQSKLANILFSLELSKRLEGTGVSTYSLHPGGIMTEILRNVDFLQYPGISHVLDLVVKSGVLPLKDLLHGAQTQICCAVDPKLSQDTGKYYEDCRQVEPADQARDESAARRLWEMSEKLVKL